MMTKATFVSLFALALAAGLSGCGGGTVTDPARRENIERQRQNVPEVFQREDGGLLDIFTLGGGDPDRQVNVNRHLWTAALDVLSFLPIEQADPFTGLLVTGWGSAPGSSAAYRATVFIQDVELDARSLRLALFRQVGGRAVPVSGEVAERIENAILTRAREIRIAADG